MKGPIQKSFEVEARGTLRALIWSAGLLSLAGVMGITTLIGVFSVFIAGLWTSNLLNSVMARRILKKYYGVESPPWREKGA